MIVEQLLVLVILIYIIDLSGFVPYIKRALLRFLGKPLNTPLSLKPFDCVFCMNFWVGLVLSFIYSHSFIIWLGNMVYVLTLSFFSPVLKDGIVLIQDLLTKLMDKVYKKL